MERTGFRFELIRSALAEKDNVLTVTELCDMAGVSRSGYYGWLKAERIRQEREERDQADFQRILDAYRFRGYDKGVRGIHMRLLHIGIRMNPKKIRRLMRKYKLFCPIRKRQHNPSQRPRLSLHLRKVHPTPERQRLAAVHVTERQLLG